MYAIRSYYVVFFKLISYSFNGNFQLLGPVEGVYFIQFSKNQMVGGEPHVDILVAVITSYSIHYTKLYEHLFKIYTSEFTIKTRNAASRFIENTSHVNCSVNKNLQVLFLILKYSGLQSFLVSRLESFQWNGVM